MANVSETRFAQAVRKELARARELHGKQNNLHEAYAVILEEVDELWDVVKMRQENRDPAHLAKELAQIAAMCQRACEDLGFANELPQLEQ